MPLGTLPLLRSTLRRGSCTYKQRETHDQLLGTTRSVTQGDVAPSRSIHENQTRRTNKTKRKHLQPSLRHSDSGHAVLEQERKREGDGEGNKNNNKKAAIMLISRTATGARVHSNLCFYIYIYMYMCMRVVILKILHFRHSNRSFLRFTSLDIYIMYI